jgi:hypothetical protein
VRSHVVRIAKELHVFGEAQNSNVPPEWSIFQSGSDNLTAGGFGNDLQALPKVTYMSEIGHAECTPE